MIAMQAPPVYGGAGAQAVSLGRILSDSHGIHVDLLTLNQLNVSRVQQVGERMRILRCPGEPLFTAIPNQRLVARLRSFVFVFWLLFRLNADRYDLLHIHGAYWWTLPAALTSRLRRIPLIVKVTRLGEDDAATVGAKRFAGLPVGRVYRLSFAWASAVVAVSEEIATRHRRSHPTVPVHRLANAVDTGRFFPDMSRRGGTRSSYGLSPSARLVLFVGYLAPVKGLRPLLEAWRDVSATHSGPGTPHLVLAGPDHGFYRELDDELSAWIQSQVGQQDGVTMLGHIERSAMPDLYRCADAYVLPSLSEGMPNSLLEALACGLPAVVTDIPGTRDVAEGCAAARLVPPGDSRALAHALRRVLTDSAGQSEVAVQYVAERFSLEALSHAYLALYTELVSQ